MSIGRDAMGVSVLGDRLIAVGGYDGQSYSKIAEVYDPQTNEWEQVKKIILLNILLRNALFSI